MGMGILLGLAASLQLTAQALAGSAAEPPRKIEPEDYPEKCARKAERVETVTIAFDTSAMGEPINPVIIESTNSCFNEAALARIKQGRFLQTSGGVGLNPRKNLRASLVYDRINAASGPERKFRRSVRRHLDRVRKSLAKDEDPGEALARLEKTKEKYGDDFSLVELAAYRILCAAAHFELGDLDAAREDLRIAEKTGVADMPPGLEGATIAELRAMIEEAED